MNQIEFNLTGKEGYPRSSIQILIDGTDLISKLGEFERRFTEDIALLGDYSEMDARSLELGGRFYSQLRAENVLQCTTEKIILFVCSCGCPGCWDLHVNILRQDNKIIWSDFEQPNRGPERFEFWDYLDFGPFEFDSEQYFGELERARQQVIEL